LVSFVALWIYSIIFVFAALWFAHFLLGALKELRSSEAVNPPKGQDPVIDMEAP